MNLLDSKNSITVKSNNNKVCTAKYDKVNKLIIIDAIGEGSTEIVVKAKKVVYGGKNLASKRFL